MRHSRASAVSSFPHKRRIVIPAQAPYRHSRTSTVSSFPHKHRIVIPAQSPYRHSRAITVSPFPAKALDRHSRESGNPASFVRTTLGPRFRGDDESFCGSTHVIRHFRERFMNNITYSSFPRKQPIRHSRESNLFVIPANATYSSFPRMQPIRHSRECNLFVIPAKAGIQCR
jgi:hypothetical protein